MMPARQIAKCHALPAIVIGFVSFVVALAIAYDRRPPLEFIAGEIIPEIAAPGQQVIARWKVNWHRGCEADVFREIVGFDGIIKPYNKYKSRVPYRLGEQSPDHDVILPMGLPDGPAVYRLALQFSDCGLTSRIVPLRIPAAELPFTIARRPK